MEEKNTIFVTEFGAAGNGITNNTAAIQAAVDACPAGGTVRIPEGIFVSGALFLKSRMTLYLEKGAVLLGSSDLEDYPLCLYRFEGREQTGYASLINTADIRAQSEEAKRCRDGYIKEEEKRLKDIVIDGEGTIDANGSILKRKELEAGKGVRGRALAIRNVDNFTLRGVTVRQSPAWCVHTIFCRNVLLENVRICTKYAEDGTVYDVFNGDGFDPDSCWKVRVKNCVIESQDDCIAVKSGRDEEGRRVGIPTEDVEITGCTFRYGFGIAMGSEMSAGVRNVLVKDCVFENTYSVASVKAPRGRGGVIENIRYENLRHENRSTEHGDCRWFRGAIYVDQFYGHAEYDQGQAEAVGEGTPLIRNVEFCNVETENAAGGAIFLMGLPERPLERIALRSVRAKGKKGMTVGNVRELVLEDVEVRTMEG